MIVATHPYSKMEVGGSPNVFHRRISKKTKQHDAIMVMVDKLRNVAYFVAVKSNNFSSDITKYS